MNDRLFRDRFDTVLFVALAGLAATFIHGYYVGSTVQNHPCFLPRVLNIINPSYMASDPCISGSAARVGVRFFVSHLVAVLSRILSLPVAFFLLTWFQNAAIALVSFFVAERMFNRSKLAATVAVVLVMSVTSVELGRSAMLFHSGLDPQVLATSFALLALWKGMECKPVACTALSVLAMLFHPLVGIVGLLGLAASGLSAAFGIGIKDRKERVRKALVSVGFAAVPVGLVLLLWLGMRGEQVMATREYVALYGVFRNPHHVIPSLFLSRDWPAMAYFLVAIGISWVWWYRQVDTDRVTAARVALVVGVLLTLMLGGWLFVEVWPTRLWATLQTYRFVFALKWFGLLLFAGTIARLATGPEPGQPVVAAMMLFPVGVGQPLAVLWAHIAELIRRRVRCPAGPILWFAAAVSGAVSAGVVFLIGFRNQEFFALVTISLIALVWLAFAQRWRRYLATSAILGLALGMVILNRYYPLTPLSGLLRDTRPIFTLADTPDPVGDYCRASTPTDAVFLIPPRYERFWLSAQRSTVVKFKCLTDVSDEGLLEWRQRLADCYGEVEGNGWDAVGNMERNYRRISDRRILSVAQKYGARFAVLHKNTPSGYPELFTDDHHKVVLIVPDKMAPTVSIVAFRAAPGRVAYATAYFEWLVHQHHPDAVLGQAYGMPVDAVMSIPEATAIYHEAVANETLLDLGEPLPPWQGTGPDGYPVAALFFVSHDDEF